MSRWAGLVLVTGGVLGAVVGLVVGLGTYAPTAWFAVVEGAVLGLLAAVPVAAVLLVVPRVEGVLRQRRR